MLATVPHDSEFLFDYLKLFARDASATIYSIKTAIYSRCNNKKKTHFLLNLYRSYISTCPFMRYNVFK